MMNADEARSRYAFHQLRLARDEQERNAALADHERAVFGPDGEN